MGSYYLFNKHKWNHPVDELSTSKYHLIKGLIDDIIVTSILQHKTEGISPKQRALMNPRGHKH